MERMEGRRAEMAVQTARDYVEEVIQVISFIQRYSVVMYQGNPEPGETRMTDSFFSWRMMKCTRLAG